MSLRSRLDLSLLNNAVLDWVITVLEEELASWPRIAKNDEAILDVIAYSLNHLRPRYSVTLLGKLYARNPDEQELEEVRAQVRAALEKINQNP